MDKRVFLTVLTMASLAAPNVFAVDANEAICPPPASADPLAQVEKSSGGSKCVVIDDFANSCAYKNFIFGEKWKNREAEKSGFLGTVGTLFDADASVEGKSPDFVKVHSVLSSPWFAQMYRYWDGSGKPEKTVGSKSSGTTPNGMVGAGPSDTRFTRDQVDDFYKAVDFLRALDRTGMYFAAMDLMSALPNQEGWKTSTESKKSLFARIFDEKMNYQAAHSVGCDTVTVKSSTRGEGNTHVRKSGEGKSLSKDFLDAKTESEEKVAKHRTFYGMTESLVGCGVASTSERTTVAVIYPTCEINIPAKVFADNEPKLSSSNEKAIQESLTNDKCYQKAISDGLKPKRVAIATAASTLNNTKNYCKRDFLGLSADRGKSVQSSLSNFLGDPSIEYQLSGKGLNGDGTSGPCAYIAEERKGPGAGVEGVVELVNGKKVTRYFSEKRDPAYVSEKGEAKLEEFKYAKATVYFEDKTVPVPGAKPSWTAVTRCKRLEFTCHGK